MSNKPHTNSETQPLLHADPPPRYQQIACSSQPVPQSECAYQPCPVAGQGTGANPSSTVNIQITPTPVNVQLHGLYERTVKRRGCGWCCWSLLALLLFTMLGGFGFLARLFSHGSNDSWNPAKFPVASKSLHWSAAPAAAIAFKGDVETRLTLTEVAEASASQPISLNWSTFYSKEQLDHDIAVIELISPVDGSVSLVVQAPERIWPERLLIVADLSISSSALANLDLDLSIGSGKIDFKPLSATSAHAKRIAAHTGSGNIVFNDIEAAVVKFGTGSGDITSRVNAITSFEASTGSGDIDAVVAFVGSDSVRSVKLDTGSGSVEGSIAGYKSLERSAGSGNTRLTITPIEGSRTSGDTGSGNIEFDVTAGYIGTFELETGSGNRNVDGPNVVIDGSKNRKGSRRTSGRVGQPSSQDSAIIASAGSGNLVIHFN